MQGREKSWVWLLLPAVFWIAGGVIAYYILRRDDQRRANDCLYLGMAVTVISVIALGANAALYALYVPDPGVNL
ncbi:MAG: hypothetical protein D9C04_01665 [Nitrosopumilus sp. B06]|nr:MAG: hypothetical protein EB828_00265 [Nitrosopumilus sp. D6]RNJ80357.1 MAG: hypothetical protein D9C04_01665 [Nitrosopumilus sp. B06]